MTTSGPPWSDQASDTVWHQSESNSKDGRACQPKLESATTRYFLVVPHIPFAKEMYLRWWIKMRHILGVSIPKLQDPAFLSYSKKRGIDALSTPLAIPVRN